MKSEFEKTKGGISVNRRLSAASQNVLPRGFNILTGGSMQRGRFLCLISVAALCATSSPGASETERVRNANVAAVEYTLEAGEVLAMDALRPAVTVYLSDATIAVHDQLDVKEVKVVRGQAVFTPAGPVSIRNSGKTALHFARIEFLRSGSGRIWGTSGLPPGDKVLIENIYARVYDIRVPAGEGEPQHTHHDRVVVCLSGAELKHVLPDGKEEIATLKTGEISWRLGATHVGHNIGSTDLWVIAVEPK
jgi:hypothetical protein